MGALASWSAARTGAVGAMRAAPFGCRCLGRHAGAGTARFEVVKDEAQVVRQVFAWVGLERISLREACRRPQGMGRPTRTGLERWDATTVCGMLRSPACQGTAMFGRTRPVPPAQARLRPIRGCPNPPRHAASPHAHVPREEWISIPVPAIVDAAMFETVQGRLDESRKRKRDGRRRPGWLLQGLVACTQCGHAFCGKMARGTVGGRQPADCGHCRCIGTDARKFGGQALCRNRSLRSGKLEQAVRRQVELVLDDPQRVAAEHERRAAAAQDGPRRPKTARRARTWLPWIASASVCGVASTG